MHTTTEARPTRALYHYAALAVILLAGAGLRLHNIGSESVWWDEFSSLIHLSPPAGYEESPYFAQWQKTTLQEVAPSLFDFWQANRTLDPATMPLYYTLEYLAWNYGGHSVLLLRIISFVISMAALPLMYLFGRRLFGARAALLATALLALSPVHVQFAQEIRMYGLFTLLALASAYTFCRVADAGKVPWWAAHIAVNILLLWTHPFAVWIPFVEGLTLVLAFRDRIGRVAVWVACHAVLLVPTALYISTIRYYGVESTGSWMQMPDAFGFFGDLIGDDFVGMTYQFWAKADTLNQFLPESISLLFVNYCAYIGLGLSALVLALLVLSVRSAYTNAPESGTAVAPLQRRWLLLLFLWAFLPPLILLVLSLTWRPMIQPRYTLHCSLALYLLVSAGAVSIPRRAWRTAAMALLVAGYLFQHALLFKGPHHPDWRGAAEYIEQNAHPDDLILAHDWLWRRVFAYNLGPVPNIVSYGGKFSTQEYRSLAELCITWTELKRSRLDGSGQPRGLWVVIRTDYFNIGPIKAFDKELELLGLAWDYREFKGMQHVCVYHISDDPNVPAPPESQRPLDNETMIQLADLAGEFLFAKDYETTVALLTGRASEMNPEDFRIFSYAGMSYQEMGNIEQAAQAFEKAIAKGSDYPWDYVNVGRYYIDEGRADEAIHLVDGAFKNFPDELTTYPDLAEKYQLPCCLNALFNEMMRDAVERHLAGETVDWQELVDAYRSYPTLFEVCLGALSRRLEAGLPVDDIVTAMNEIHAVNDAFAARDLEGAQSHIEKAAAAAPDYGRAVLLPGLFKAYIMSDYDALAPAIEAAVAADPGMRQVLAPLAEAILKRDFAQTEALLAPLLVANIEVGIALYGIAERIAAEPAGAPSEGP